MVGEGKVVHSIRSQIRAAQSLEPEKNISFSSDSDEVRLTSLLIQNRLRRSKSRVSNRQAEREHRNISQSSWQRPIHEGNSDAEIITDHSNTTEQRHSFFQRTRVALSPSWRSRTTPSQSWEAPPSLFQRMRLAVFPPASPADLLPAAAVTGKDWIRAWNSEGGRRSNLLSNVKSDDEETKKEEGVQIVGDVMKARIEAKIQNVELLFRRERELNGEAPANLENMESPRMTIWRSLSENIFSRFSNTMDENEYPSKGSCCLPSQNFKASARRGSFSIEHPLVESCRRSPPAILTVSRSISPDTNPESEQTTSRRMPSEAPVQALAAQNQEYLHLRTRLRVPLSLARSTVPHDSTGRMEARPTNMLRSVSCNDLSQLYDKASEANDTSNEGHSCLPSQELQTAARRKIYSMQSKLSVESSRQLPQEIAPLRSPPRYMRPTVPHERTDRIMPFIKDQDVNRSLSCGDTQDPHKQTSWRASDPQQPTEQCKQTCLVTGPVRRSQSSGEISNCHETAASKPRIVTAPTGVTVASAVAYTARPMSRADQCPPPRQLTRAAKAALQRAALKQGIRTIKSCSDLESMSSTVAP